MIGLLVNQIHIDALDLHAIKDRHQCAYAKLARMAASSKERMWALRPKMHVACLEITYMYMCFVQIYYKLYK